MHIPQRLISNKKVALAVSGGVDSMAMAFKVSQTLNADMIHALTVDHGARVESAEEAKTVGRYLSEIGIQNHHVLRLEWPGNSISKQRFELDARRYRRSIMLDKCRELGVQHLCLAHTMDDELENFIMRLIKGSSLYGLSGMAAVSAESNILDMNVDPTKRVSIVKPILRQTKQELYDICINNGVKWVEDPTNLDPTYTIRNAIRKLFSSGQTPLALSPAQLSQTLIQLNERRESQKLNARRLLKKYTESKAIDYDERLGVISLKLHQCTEFERISRAEKTLLMYEIIRKVSPLHLEYRLSTIDKLVRDITQKKKTYISTYVNVATTLSNQDEDQQTLTMQRAIPYKREQINSAKTLEVTGNGNWTRWVLWDNRYWFRARDNTGHSRHIYISLPKVSHVDAIKRSLDGQWPANNTLITQPMLFERSANVPLGFPLGFPLLEGTFDLNGLEVQWRTREFAESA